MNGELSNVSVAGMLRLLTVHRQTGCLKVSGADGEGKIYLEQGVIVATDRPRQDLSVEVLHLLLLQRGIVEFEAMDSVPRSHPPVRLEHVEALIVEASRHADAEDLQDLLPPDSAVLQLAPLPAGREGLRLELKPEEWNLLTRVNGVATLEEVVAGTGLPRERALQAVHGLLSAGLLRKTRSRTPRVFKVANQELDTMGEALVRQAFHTLGLDPRSIRMQDLIALLDELEDSLTQLLGPSRAEAVLTRMWEDAKR
jgi:hypothetical protein